jgi:hypothetical protein
VYRHRSQSEQRRGLPHRTTLEEKTAYQYRCFRDLVFIQDCTGSQGSYITSATKNIEEISRAIFQSGKLVYPDDLRLGLIAFRDHPPQDHTYITKNFGFTSGSLVDD